MMALSISTCSAVAAVLEPLIVAGTLHEDAAHREGRGGEEMSAAIPGWWRRAEETRR